MLDLNVVQEAAERVRRVLATPALLPPHRFNERFFGGFPKDCCDHASDILGVYLLRKLDISNDCVFGESLTRPACKHVWLEVTGAIVDITADQFDGMTTRVVVSRESRFHTRFVEKRRRKPAFPESCRDYFEQIFRVLD